MALLPQVRVDRPLPPPQPPPLSPPYAYPPLPRDPDPPPALVTRSVSVTVCSDVPAPALAARPPQSQCDALRVGRAGPNAGPDHVSSGVLTPLRAAVGPLGSPELGGERDVSPSVSDGPPVTHHCRSGRAGPLGPSPPATPPSSSVSLLPSAPAASLPGTLQLVFWNARGLNPHIEQLRRFLLRRGSVFCGVSETHMHDQDVDCAGFQWVAGVEQKPDGASSRVPGGIGALVHGSVRAIRVRSDPNAMWMRLDTGTRRPLFVATVYAPQSGARAERRRMWADLRAAVLALRPKGAIVIGGDFNGRTAANGDAKSNAAGAEITEFCDQMRFVCANHEEGAEGLFSYYEERRFGRADEPPVFKEFKSTNDYALVDADEPALWSDLSFRIVEDWHSLSDHRPIILSLPLCLPAYSQPLPQQPRCLRWKRVYDAEALKARTERGCDGWVALHRQRWAQHRSGDERGAALIVNELASALTNMAISALRAVVGASSGRAPRVKSIFGFYSPVYNRLVQRIQVSGRILDQAVRSGSGERRIVCRTEHLTLQCERKAMAKRLTAQSRGRFFKELEETAKEPERFWRTQKVLFRSSAPSSAAARRLPSIVYDSNQELVSDSLGVNREWAGAFESVSRAAPPTVPHAISFALEVTDSLLLPFDDLSPSHRGVPLHELERTVTLEEVRAAIQRMRKAVASGPDSVPAFFFKDGGAKVVGVITALLNDVLTHGVWPSDWLLGWISPIFKKGSRLQPLDYRGITLLPIIDKLCRSVLNCRLSAAIEERRLLSDFQAGFRARHGTMDHLLTLNEIATAHRERKRPLYMAFLDVRKAYDQTWRSGVWHRMRKIGVPDRVLRVWRSSYRQVRRSVLVNEEITDEFECEAGLAQGAVDSPTLYDVFVDELAALLLAHGFGVSEGLGERIPLLMYADDIVLLAASPEQLQRMLVVVQWFAERWQFQYNISKSAVVIAGHATPALREAARAHVWVLAGEHLPVPDYYTYLGVEFGLMGGGRWTPVIDRLLTACRWRAARLLWANGNRHGTAPGLQVRLWSAVCRPQLEYGCALWGTQLSGKQRRKLESAQHEFACSALGLAHNTTREFIQAELGLLPLSARRDELTMRVFGVIMCMPSTRLVHRVVRRRLLQVHAGSAAQSWCALIRPLFVRYNLDARWRSGAVGDEKAWRTTCFKAVRATTRVTWAKGVAEHARLALYRQLKVGPLSESYLSDSSNREGRFLKLLLRSGNLPLMPVLASVLRLGPGSRVRCCPLCVAAARASGATEDSASVRGAPVEDSEHFVMRCPALNGLRAELLHRLYVALLPSAELVSRWLLSASHADSLLFLSGGGMSTYRPSSDAPDALSTALYRQMVLPTTVKVVDRNVQNFLLLAWRRRISLLGGRWACVWYPAHSVGVRCAPPDADDAPPRPPIPSAPHAAFSAPALPADCFQPAADPSDPLSAFSAQVVTQSLPHSGAVVDGPAHSSRHGGPNGEYRLEFQVRASGRSAEMRRRASGSRHA